MLSWIKFGVVTVLSLAMVLVPVNLPATQPKLEQLAEWKAPPVVRVCYNTPIFKYKVEEALGFWEKLGYKFGTLSYEDNTEWCTGDTYFGAITIMPNREYLGAGTLALTRRHTYNKIITGARIEISNQGFGKELILEHELGHTLGWPHYRIEGHIMHPILPKAGINVFGLKNT